MNVRLVMTGAETKEKRAAGFHYRAWIASKAGKIFHVDFKTRDQANEFLDRTRAGGNAVIYIRNY